jgi:hypothetical protein
MDLVLSTVIQLSPNVAPVAPTLCSQALIKRADGKHQLVSSTQFLNLPPVAATTGEIVGASSVDPARSITPTQAQIVIALHKAMVCATLATMP